MFIRLATGHNGCKQSIDWHSFIRKKHKKFYCIDPRENVKKIVAASKAKFNNKIRLGFVGYRDYMDAERYIVTPFSTDSDVVIQKMNAIVANGGGDLPGSYIHFAALINNNLILWPKIMFIFIINLFFIFFQRMFMGELR